MYAILIVRNLLGVTLKIHCFLPGLSVHAQPAQATPSKKVLEAVLEKLKK
jgi:hypothetical protein